MGTPTDRRRGGAALGKLLVWVIVLFVGYGGFKALSYSMTKSNIENAMGTALERVRHDMSDGTIQARVAKQLATMSVELDQEEIFVERETRPGERVIQVSAQHPIHFSFLGSEKTVVTDVSATQVIRVDEVALARKEKTERREREDAERFHEELQATWDDCEAKHGKGGCSYTETPSARNEIVRGY